MSPKKWVRPWWVGGLTLITLVSGCTQNANQGSPALRTGTYVGQNMAAPRQMGTMPYTALRVHPVLASRINRLHGVTGAVVLQEGNRVYVGTNPEKMGTSGTTVTPPAGYRGTQGASGAMTPVNQEHIRSIIYQAIPDATTVLMTSDFAATNLLRRYASYVASGGAMDGHMREFHERIRLIWPGGRPVSATRPSASPDANALGTAVP